MDFGGIFGKAWQRFVSDIVPLVLFWLAGAVLMITIILIPTVVGGWIRGTTGLVRDGRKPDFSELWNFDQYLPILGFMILSGIGITIGYMLLILPGIVLTVWWMYGIWFLVDQRLDVGAAFGASKQAVSRTGFFNHFVVLVIVWVLNMAGSALAGFGVLLTAPFVLVFMDVVYLDVLNGEGGDTTAAVTA